MHYPDAVERAFQLASSGKFESVAQIQRQLSREGYDGTRISGPILVRQIKKLISKREGHWNTYLKAKAAPSG